MRESNSFQLSNHLKDDHKIRNVVSLFHNFDLPTMDNANVMTERTYEVEETTIGVKAGSQNFSDKNEKYLTRAVLSKL